MGLQRTRNGTPDVKAIPFAESLERRQLLAGIEAGILVARGTVGNDAISVRRWGNDDVIISTNGLLQQFDMDDFTSVRVEGLAGDDTFNLIDPLVSPVVRNSTILGGEGTDILSYAGHTADISFRIDPSGSQATTGAQTDSFDEIELARGGAGNDTFEYGNFTPIAPGEQNLNFSITLAGQGGADRFVDSLEAGHNFGRVDIFAGSGNDTFENDEQGQEFFFGSDGNDSVFLTGSTYPAGMLDGGNGADSITFAERAGGNIFNLGDFSGFENGVSPNGGLLIGNSLNNELKLLAQGTIQGGDGNDTLVGSSAADLLLGQNGNDWLAGRDGTDTLDGGDGIDTIDGGAGPNTNLNGEAFAGQSPGIAIVDRILNVMGGTGNDTITIDPVGSDDFIVRVGGRSLQFDADDIDGVLIQSFAGNDRVTVSQAIVAGGTIARRVTIDGGGGNDTLTGTSANDVLRGNFGDDLLSGLSGRDALFGGAGNDQLLGGRGVDFLDAGEGNDFIDASDSAPGDTVLGGSGTDTAKVDVGDGTISVETLA